MDDKDRDMAPASFLRHELHGRPRPGLDRRLSKAILQNTFNNFSFIIIMFRDISNATLKWLGKVLAVLEPR